VTALAKLPAPLLKWYDENRRILPWREQVSPYRTWVSEIMLQQTRVSAVLPYFERFMEAFPSLSDLACAEEETLMRLWQGLGYYSRARNLQKTAQLLTERGEITLPDNYGELCALPGIGEYTAGAILSIAYGQRISAVDGNVLRIVSRITGFEGDVLEGKNRKLLRAWVEEILPEERCGAFNQALMDLGAAVCLPGGVPLCEQCVARAFCEAYRTDRQRELPVRIKKAEKKEELLTVFVLRREDGTVALRKRGEGLLAGLWEFPNVPGHLTEEEVAAYLEENRLIPHKWIKQLSAKHEFTHIRWKMIGYIIEVMGNSASNWSWCDEREMDSRAIPSAFEVYKREVQRL